MTNAQFIFDKTNHRYLCQGNWSILNLNHLNEQLNTEAIPQNSHISIHGGKLLSFDSGGALVLFKWIKKLEQAKTTVDLIEFHSQHLQLLDLIKNKQDVLDYQPKAPEKHNLFYQIGEETIHKIHQFTGLVELIGDLTNKIMLACRQWRRFQFASIISNIESTGLRALPILALLSFLIGVVLAYQMGLQLETYGASIFIAYLSGMAIFREFAPLITAIIVAGRTSSAFTAQIGSMKINEEIDALYTMGLSPTELLVVPKVLGLLLAFPLLIFWSDVFSTLGAMIMSKFMLNVGYIDFLTRLQESVGFKQMALGLYKAPAFALLIALVGCFQGFRVELNADSVGTQTTKSVVQALFLIIVTDATYSVIYSWLDL